MPSTRAWQEAEFSSDGSRGIHEWTVCRSAGSVKGLTRGWYQWQEAVTTAILKGQGEKNGATRSSERWSHKGEVSGQELQGRRDMSPAANTTELGQSGA